MMGYVDNRERVCLFGWLKIPQLVNAAALRESQTATQQGKDIGLLTNMTVVSVRKPYGRSSL
jgi:hypothetical protein